MNHYRGTLKTLLSRHALITHSEMFSEWSVWRQLDHLSSALDYLHTSLATPILHRDLKPENILCVSHKGSICLKLADFGLGKLLTTDSAGKMYASSLVGTFNYIAPELVAAIWTNQNVAYGAFSGELSGNIHDD